MDKKVKEILRKSIHISSLSIPMFYRYVMHYNKAYSVLILFALAIISLVVEYFRLENRSFKKLFYGAFGIMLRKHELHDFTGASFLLTSSIICIAFFPRDIAFLALSFLAIGDTFAALTGMTVGKRKFAFTKKSLEGSLGCFISTFIFSLFYIHPLIGLSGALSATIAELIDLPVDDNVRMPIISGIIMTITSIFVSNPHSLLINYF